MSPPFSRFNDCFDCCREFQSPSVVGWRVICQHLAKIELGRLEPGRLTSMTGNQTMDMHPPPAFVQVAQNEVPPDAPVEPVPIKVDVSKYIPESATAVTMIVTLTPPTGQAVIYAAGH